MQQELQQALANLINKTTSGAEYLGQKAVDGAATATEFLKQEIPDVIKQLLLWEFTYYLLLFVGGIVVMGLCLYVIYKAFAAVKKHGAFSKDGEPVFFLPLVATTAAAFVFSTWIYPQLLNLVWLKIWLAPKLYLIQYAANLIKG